MGLTCLDVPRPAWPAGPLPTLVSVVASWTLGLAAGLLGIGGLGALGAGVGALWGLTLAPVGIVAGAVLTEALWPARVTVRRSGGTVHLGRLRLPAATGVLEVGRGAPPHGDLYQVRWRGPAGEVRACASGPDALVLDAYAEGLGRVGGYPVRWVDRRPGPERPDPDPAALARAVRMTRPAPGTVVLRPRGPGWHELLLGSLVLWAGTGLAVAVAYPFAPGPLGFSQTLLAWEGASTLLVAAYLAAPVAAPLEVEASPAGLCRVRRLLWIRVTRTHLVPAAVVALSLTRRTRWEVFAATGGGAVGLGRYTLRDDAEAVRQVLGRALEGESHQAPEPEARAPKAG